MRPGQQKQRGRGRNSSGGGSSNNNSSNNNNQRKGQNPLTRTYDSSGPDVKIRGTAQHIAEKYMNLARDATSSGDRVMAENYLQHAEHYNRIIAAAQAMFQERYQRDDRPEYSGERGDQGDQGDQGDRGEMNDRDERDEDDNNEGQQPSESGNYNRQPDNRERQNDNRNRDRQSDNRDRDRQSDNRDRQPENNNRQSDNRNRQPIVTEQPVIIDQTTPQPVFDETPAEVQIEQEAAAGEQPAAGTRRRSNAGRPRRTPRQPRGETPAAEAPAEPVEEPAE
ncbi:DUF4167 domain-containing protein [Rhizobium sp. LjRoot254]|uniref:DUF4167 domain-containing protein n=1 Tax=Rhizobium sp. LjRoot254 TaxID=3342297 RepID=UPI003ED117D0